MDVREKMVYLVKNALRAYGKDLEKVVEPYEFIADLLIHSGVTVQEDCKDCAEATQNCIVKLQEQIAEFRSVQELDGCEYCNEDSDGYRKMLGAFSITNPFHGNVWNIETCHCKPRQIYFCPMCGRRLPKPPKGE